MLTLSGGVYDLEGLNIGDRGKVLCAAACEIRIASRLEPGQNGGIGPAPGSGIGATDIEIFVGGINGSTGNLGATPKAATIGYDNVVQARIFVPNGTLWLKAGTTATGTFIGKDVEIGENVVLTKDVPGTCENIDDFNPCTVDSCDSASGQAIHTPQSGASCSDGDACNGAETCDANGFCQVGTAPTADDGNACTTDSCNPATGVSHEPVAANAPCDDGNACTGPDACDGAGVCQPGSPVEVDDGNACTGDACEPANGVSHTPLSGSPCNDGNACTQTDTCQSGVCVGANPVACTALDQCHEAGACDTATGLCSNPSKADGSTCNDADACTQYDTCQAGACVGVGAVTCAPLDQCHEAGTCDPLTGACSNPAKPDASPCDDGDACTQTDACQAGTCAGTNPIACAAIDQCHEAGACDPTTGSCSTPAKPDGSACDDSDACTAQDSCQAGTCQGASPVVCAPLDQCHEAGACNPSTGQCSNPAKADGSACDDGNACTQSDSCQTGGCVGSSPIACTALDQCHDAGVCDPSTGVCTSPPKPDGAPCDDSNACTTGEVCTAGSCAGGTSLTCAASDQCHEPGACDPASGACSNPVKIDGSSCDDADACTEGEACTSGSCSGGTPVAVDDANSCTADACDPLSGVSHPPLGAGTPCGDSDVCNGNEACDGAGTCQPGTPLVVDDGNPCTIDACDPVSGATHQFAPEGTSCSNGNPCDGGETCNGTGACQPGTPPALDDGNPCTTDGCNPALGVTHDPLPPGSSCNDATVCNGSETCDAAGLCQPGTPLVVDDGKICTIDACDPVDGVTHTVLPDCDGAPAASSGRFETRASVLGRVVDASGAAVTGYSLSVFEAPIAGPARSDVQVAIAADGSFRARLTEFPETVPDRTPPLHVIVKIESPAFIPIMREAFLRPGDVPDLGSIVVLPRDPSVTSIGPAGGVATDSQGLIEITIPAGALSSTVPIRITPVPTREQFPFPLPDVTVTGYGMVLEPSGTQFAIAATLKAKNTRNFPTSIEIPVGVLNEAHATWQHEGLAVWDGSRFVTTLNHFSFVDLNPTTLMDLVLVERPGGDPDKRGAGFCSASRVSYGSGGLSEDVGLASYKRAGQSHEWSLSYSSNLAGSNSINTPSESADQAASPSGYLKTIRGRRLDKFCVQKGGMVPAGGSVCSLGGILCNPALPPPTLVISMDMLGLSTQKEAQTTINGQGYEIMGSTPIPLNADGTTAAPQYSVASMQWQLQQYVSGLIEMCLGSGGDFGAPGSPQAGQPGQAEMGPFAGNDYVLTFHRRASPFGAGWGLKQVNELYRRPDGNGYDLIHGDGTAEAFWPRVEASVLAQNVTPGGFERAAIVRDPASGKILVAKANKTISEVQPDGSMNVLVSGITFPAGATATPMSLAVGSVGTERYYLVALAGYLLEVNTTGQTRVLYAAVSQNVTGYERPTVAARGREVYFTFQGTDAVFHVRLDDPLRTVVPITQPENGHRGLDHYNLFASQVVIPDPRGLAVDTDGGLYVASALNSAVYKILPDATGVASEQSGVARVLGSGFDKASAFAGMSRPALKMAVPQPVQLSLAPDGTLFVATASGALAYDPVELSGRWLFFEPSVKHSDVSWSFFENGSFVADVDKAAFILTYGRILRVTANEIASEDDPTRRIVATPTGAVLTDTTNDIVETYGYLDATKQQMVMNLRSRRSGELLFAVGYAPGTNRVTSLSDLAGGTTTFNYGASNKIQSIVDPANRVTSLTVDASGDLTAIQAPTGETRTFGYTAHRLTSATDPRGNTTEYTYKPNGTIDTTKRPGGGMYQASAGFSNPTYDSTGKLVYTATMTDDRGVLHTVALNEKGQIQRDAYTADGTSYEVLTTYVTTLFGPVAHSPVLDRKNTLLRVRDTRVNGLQVTPLTTYDDQGRPKQTDMPLNAITSGQVSGESAGAIYKYVWGADGRLSAVAPSVTNIFWPIARDPVTGRITKIHDEQVNSFGPTGRQTLFTWRDDGQPATITEHGVTTTHSYDPINANLTGTVDTLGRTLTLGYAANGSGNVTSTNDGTTTVTFTHDDSNRLTAISDAAGNTTTLGYSQAGCNCSHGDRVTSLTTPDLAPGQKWSFGYDPDGRLASVTDPLGKTEGYLYTPQGDLSTFTDRKQRQTSFSYDQLGRPAATLDPAGRRGTFAYPVPISGAWTGASLFAGSPDSQAAPTSLTASLRDGEYQIGLREHRTGGYPAQVELYRDATFELSFGRQFDAYQRPINRRDRAGQPIASGSVLGSQYNFAQQLGYNLNTPAPVLTGLTSTYPAQGFYEWATYTTNAEFDVTLDQGLGSQRPYATSTYTRDPAGRITGIQTQIAVPGDPNQPYWFNSGIAYDAVNKRQITGISTGSGGHGFTYDARGLLATRTPGFKRYWWVLVNGTDYVLMDEDVNLGAFTYQYDELGRNTVLDFPDGHRRVQQWDELGRLTARCYEYPTTAGSPGSAPTRCYSAVFDDIGNPTLVTDPERSCSIGYDSLDRLTSVSCSDGSTESYTYNALGALSFNADTAVEHQRPRLDGGGNASAGLPSSIGGQPVGIDAVGRVTSLNGNAFPWNHLGRPSLFGYNASLRPVFSGYYASPPTVGPMLLYEGSNVVAQAHHVELKLGIDRRFGYDDIDHPLWMYDRETEFVIWYELDVLGNVRRLRGGPHTVSWEPNAYLPTDLGGYNYTAFGKLLPPDAGTPTPSYVQPIRWQGRWYMNLAGGLYDFRNRFWSPDLGAFLSPDEFGYLSPRGTLWSWPNQNPIRWRDPSGRDAYGQELAEALYFGAMDDPGYAYDVSERASGAGFAAAFTLVNSVLIAAELAPAILAGGNALKTAAAGAMSALSGAKGCADKAARGGTTTLYRAVSEAEYKQLMQTGRFAEGPNSLGGKFFAESAADAAKWGDRLQGAGNYRIISAELPTSTANQLMRWERLDAIGPARYGELEELTDAIIRSVR